MRTREAPPCYFEQGARIPWCGVRAGRNGRDGSPPGFLCVYRPITQPVHMSDDEGQESHQYRDDDYNENYNADDDDRDDRDDRDTRRSFKPKNAAVLPTCDAVSLPGVVQSLEMPFYDLDNIQADATVLITGKRGSGKTTFMRNVMYAMRNKLDVAVLMCPSADVRDDFRQFLPSSFVYDFEIDRLNSIVDCQIKLAPEVGKERLRRVGIILDDCMYDAKTMRNKSMRNVIMNGRHNKFFFMNCTQHAPDFPKSMRGNLDLIVVFPPPNDEVFKTVYQNLLSGAFRTQEECRAAFDSLNAHECLVFDPKAQTEKRPFIFYCKAQHDLPRFRVGSDVFWRLHYTYFKRAPSQVMAIANAVAVAKGLMVPRAQLQRPTGRGDGGAANQLMVRRGPAPVFGGGGRGVGRAIGAAVAAGGGGAGPRRRAARSRSASARFSGHPMLGGSAPIIPHSIPPPATMAMYPM